MTQKTTEKIFASILFFFATLLTGLMSFVALGFVWARIRPSKRQETQRSEGFLADEQRALDFYRIFSFAYDVLNPYFYTNDMRRDIVSQLPGGTEMRVLDLGCGTGYTTIGVLGREDVREVVGLDMNSVQLKRAAKKLSGEKRRVEISRGDADQLPFIDESFDAVISVGAVENFPHPEKVLKELTRVTKPNGTIVVGGPEMSWFSKLGINRVLYTPSAQEMEKVFREANLVEIKTLLTGVKTFFGTGKYVIYAVGTKPA